MYYVGVDLHKETSWFYIVDAQSKKYDSKNIQNQPEILKSISNKFQSRLLWLLKLPTIGTSLLTWLNSMPKKYFWQTPMN